MGQRPPRDASYNPNHATKQLYAPVEEHPALLLVLTSSKWVSLNYFFIFFCDLLILWSFK